MYSKRLADRRTIHFEKKRSALYTRQNFFFPFRGAQVNFVTVVHVYVHRSAKMFRVSVKLTSK